MTLRTSTSVAVQTFDISNPQDHSLLIRPAEHAGRTQLTSESPTPPAPPCPARRLFATSRPASNQGAVMRTATSIPALCAAVSLFIFAPRDRAQIPITPVVVSSKSDATGSIYNITINDAGVVTTKLRAHGVGALYAGKPGDLHLVASEGGMIHDLKLNVPVPVSIDGQIAFGADLAGGVNALWGGALGSFSLVAQQGGPAPGA